MKKRNTKTRRFFASLLVSAMVFTTAFGSSGLGVSAADNAGFTEVTVPNGDFESGETGWTFTGDVQGLDYYWKLFASDVSSAVNKTNMYEVCSKKNTTVTKSYTCSQTVKNLVPGIYRASIEAMGGNDPGTHTTTLTAGGKSVAVTPTAWNVWNTYTTDTFEVGEDGSCEIVIASTVTGQYIDMDNVKLWRQGEAVPKAVDSVQPITRKASVGSTFTAPAQATVLYTDGSRESFDVTWNAQELAAVDTATAGKSFTVNGTVTVEEQAYPAVMTVEILDASGLVQEVAEDALGSIDFNENWQFYLATRTPEIDYNGDPKMYGAYFAEHGVKDAGDYTTEEIVAEDFDDLGWRTVDVPHDFSIEGEKVSSSVDAQAYLQGGLGYYRKKFTVPASMKESRIISLDFEGVYQNSVVYLNGEEVGGYPNGYTGFALDITNRIKYGEENVLVVKVQNMSPSGRWYTGSGIIRPVHLVVDHKMHFNRNGITLTAPNLEDAYTKSKSAYLEVQAEGYSDASNSNIYMEVTVYDADGKQVAKKQTEATSLNPTTAFALDLKGRNALTIPDVQLWHPWNLGTPYLYTVKADLYMQDNGVGGAYELVDSEEMEYGFRWVEVKESTSDPNSGGLYVNGTYTKVQGVDLHHDSGALGAASYTDAYEREFGKLKDMGVNAYRTSHCPPSRQAIEVCRRMGILVVEEAFDGWGVAKATYDFGNFFFREVPADWAGLKPNGYTTLPAPATNYTGAKLTWSDWVIQEMVKRDKNEPSIIAWSIGNEVRGVGSKPSWYDLTKYDTLGVNPTGMNEYTEAVRLSNNVKAADGTRYILMGGDQERNVPDSTKSVWGLVNQVLDGYGLNYNTAASVDGLINRFSIGDGTLLGTGTKTFFFESESSSQTSSRGVYLDPQFSNTGINQTPGHRGGSNYDNDFASWTMSNEYGLKKDRDRKHFIGQFIWTGFDYLGEPTPYAVYPVGVSSFGTIDTAGFPKDSFYLYQSQWVTEPMVHLLPTNWDQWHEGETVEVWVNTNQPSAELFLNGESLGRKSFDEKETAYGKKYYETSEKTTDDKTWKDAENPGGYSSKGAKLDEGELNSGKLHLTWEVPYQAGKLEVKAYDKDGKIVAEDSVETSSVPYTIQAVADRTVLAADGSSLSYVECTIVDEHGNMVPDADNLVKFSVSGDAVSIVGVDNGKQESTELYKYGNTDSSKYSERSAYNGKVLVILQSEKETGDAVLTISSEDLKPVQTALKVTADGKGAAPAVPEVTGTEKKADPVMITVPAGMDVTLPSAVRVHYTGNAGDYSLMRPVTWGELKNGKAQGTIEGCSLKASAEVTESAEAQTDVELATGKAEATASFTGSTNNYPEKMVDGKAGTSWTNAYNRGASVLLPANSASRRSEYVEFSWKEAQVMNQIALNFTGAISTAVPSVLEVQYWNGVTWAKVSRQVTVPGENTVTMQFMPVYAAKLRVYMENATPYTENGNIDISEASVKLSTEEFGVQALLSSGEVTAGKIFASAVQLVNLPNDRRVTEISFTAEYDAEAFDAPEIMMAEGMAGELTSAEKDGKTVYTYTNADGIPADTKDFAVIRIGAKAEAAAGSYVLTLSGMAAKDDKGEKVSISALPAAVTVKERPIEGEVTYLSDMEWKSATSGWESVEKDKNCNGSNSSGIALKVDGVKKAFEKGLGACADSEIIYDLTAISQTLEEKETLYFQAYVGVDYFKTEAGNNGDGMYFIVYGTLGGEEKELYRSKLLDTNSGAEHISLNITGATQLRLVMDKNGNNAHDNGDWADAKLIRVPDPDAAVKTELKEALDAAKAFISSDYTVETYEALAKVIKEAEAAFANKEVTQEEVDVLVQKLMAAASGLKAPGAEEYQELLEQLGQKNDEIQEWKDKVEELQEKLEKEEGDMTQINSALKDAKDKVTALEKEKAGLAEQIGRALADIEALKKNQGSALKKGDTEEYGKVIYRVTDAGQRLAEAYGVVNADVKSLKVADTVVINGVTCKVTAVAGNAFKSLTKLKQAVIGKNVTKIGKKAFYGDRKLKKIQVKGTVLKSVGKASLKGIFAKAVIKVPKSKKKAYAKLFKGKGQKKSVKVK